MSAARQEPGRQEPGRQEPGRQEPGRPDSNQHGPNSRRTILTFGVLMQVLIVVAVSCGVPTDESSFQAIDGNEIPQRLNDTTSTTTTTTTTSTVPATPDPPIDSTSTTTNPPVAVEPVEIYFLFRGFLQPFSKELNAGYSLIQLVAALEDGPTDGPLGAGFSSLVDDGLIVGVPSIEAGVISIDLDPDVFAEISARNQRQAIAQIVFTFLKNTTAVGQVTFTLGGKPFLAPTDPGLREFVTIDDYATLLPGGVRPTSTLPDDFDGSTTTTTSG